MALMAVCLEFLSYVVMAVPTYVLDEAGVHGDIATPRHDGEIGERGSKAANWRNAINTMKDQGEDSGASSIHRA